jgi:peroxiredoxin
MNSLEVGDTAPLWDLEDQNGRIVSLREHVGQRNILLSFHPLAWTPVCSRQMQDLEAKHDELARLDTVAYGLSVDSAPCKNAWARSLGITKTSLPSDFWPHGAVASLYGVFLEHNGYSGRAAFIIDKKGLIAFSRIYPMRQVPDVDEIMRAVRSMGVPVGASL